MKILLLTIKYEVLFFRSLLWLYWEKLVILQSDNLRAWVGFDSKVNGQASMQLGVTTNFNQ